MTTLTRAQLDERIRILQVALHGDDPSRHQASSWEDVASELMAQVSPVDRAYASERIRSVLAEFIDFYSDDHNPTG